MPLIAGDLGYMAGLNQARWEARADMAKWQQFSNGLQQQINSLASQLQAERVYRTENRANIAGVMSALSTLPPDVQKQVQAALTRHFSSAFVDRATELGLPQNYASDSAKIHLRETLRGTCPRVSSPR